MTALAQKIGIELKVNGAEWALLVEPRATLLEVLREELGLTGAKEGCGLGACGTCTVLIDGRPARSCLTLASEVQGQEIVTIEGLADLWPNRAEGELHPIQEAFVESHGIQCGFCTPGMILASKALLDEVPHPTEAEAREAISGQACRCTGYTKIVDAIHNAAERLSSAQASKEVTP
ncbi:MAG: (2Fe-2S)-binding protein [Deltaproteobacteria bacterium]|nr:(2Fe-2S)-binding protein [Deltaproteobacteria bacterium]